MEKKERMLRFLNSMYVPKAKTDDFVKMLEFMANHDLRDVEREDTDKVGVDVLVIDSAGRGKFETFHGWIILKADFDKVSSTYANVYLYQEGSRGKPRRVFRESNKFAVIAN